MTTPNPLVLIILDGFGYREETKYNAIASANTPNWDHYWQSFAHTLIEGSGKTVGLPDGQMGNSEVGHLHMGAGRLVPQDLMRIDDEIANGDFFRNPVLTKAFDIANEKKSAVHIFGLLSPGGVHSHENHLIALIQLAAQKNAKKVYVHGILDGRDTPPRSALSSIAKMEKAFKDHGCGQFASIIGRYYAMDRDQRWDRTEKAYNLFTLGEADYIADSAAVALEMAYERNENDEFVKSTLITHPHKGIVQDDDVIIFANFRADRVRQLSRAFLFEDFPYFKRIKRPAIADFVTMTQYAANIYSEIAYPPFDLENVLGDYLAQYKLRQLRIAETEKYAHVTFFFNGGREEPFENEDRILVPSPKIATYDLQPEMSALQLTDELVKAICSSRYDVIICNFANADMVGHSGNMAATIEAIEVIDECLGRILSALQKAGGEAIITSDHGNAELMFDEKTEQPHTAHTSQKIPFLYVGRPAEIIDHHGNLTDIAPTMLTLLNLEIPPQMTGKSLVKLVS